MTTYVETSLNKLQTHDMSEEQLLIQTKFRKQQTDVFAKQLTMNTTLNFIGLKYNII